MAKNAGGKVVTLEQWVEVRVRDGKTVTTLYPANDVLRERAQKMDPPPDMVYRRLNFADGVPIEYSWTTDDAARRRNGGHGIQRMAIETWLETMRRRSGWGTDMWGRVRSRCRGRSRAAGVSVRFVLGFGRGWSGMGLRRLDLQQNDAGYKPTGRSVSV